MSDEITLTMPPERPFYGVAHLVLGGVAARAALTIEHLEDLELALDGLLDRVDVGSEVTVALRLADDGLAAKVGPFAGDIRSELASEPDERLSLRRLLDAVVDGYDVETQHDRSWIELRKKIGTAT